MDLSSNIVLSRYEDETEYNRSTRKSTYTSQLISISNQLLLVNGMRRLDQLIDEDCLLSVLKQHACSQWMVEGRATIVELRTRSPAR